MLHLLVLFKVGCGHCESVLEGIANSDWLKDEELADVYALAMDRGILDKTTYQEVNINADNVKDFRATYCSAANGRIQFGIHSRVKAFFVPFLKIIFSNETKKKAKPIISK